MINREENIVHGATIPNYILNSQSNLSQFFTRLLSEHGNKTAIVSYFLKIKCICLLLVFIEEFNIINY